MAQRQWVKRPVMERGWIFLRDSNSGESAPGKVQPANAFLHQRSFS